MIDADGTGLRRLTNAAGSDANPAFSPKGDLIAFESNRDGTLLMPAQIYVMKADGTGDAREADELQRPDRRRTTSTRQQADLVTCRGSHRVPSPCRRTGCARPPRGLHDER